MLHLNDQPALNQRNRKGVSRLLAELTNSLITNEVNNFIGTARAQKGSIYIPNRDSVRITDVFGDFTPTVLAFGEVLPANLIDQ